MEAPPAKSTVDGIFAELNPAVFRHRVPHSPLSGFIEILWYYKSVVPEVPCKERILPTGSSEFVIRLGKNINRVYDPARISDFKSYSGSIVTGTQSKFFVLDRSDQDALLGVHFKPGGTFPFFGVPANELQDCHASLEDLWKSRAQDLRSEVMEAPTVELKFCVVEKYLMEAAMKNFEVRHRAVRFALNQFQNDPAAMTVSEMADRVGLSQRRFIQVFSEQVGLTPKVYHRVSRFQKVLKTIHRKEDFDWTEVALSCGYFDQAHLIHDFRSFAGLSPTAYLLRRTPHLNHVPIHHSEI